MFIFVHFLSALHALSAYMWATVTDILT